MRTREPADKHYGEKRPLTPGVHQDKAGQAASRAGLGNNRVPINPMNWRGYQAGVQGDRVYSSPYGDTTVVTPTEGLVVTKAQQQVMAPRGNNPGGVIDSRVDKERPNRKPLGMSTGLRLGGGPQRNVPRG
jgi:hypothetical protein